MVKPRVTFDLDPTSVVCLQYFTGRVFFSKNSISFSDLLYKSLYIKPTLLFL